MERILEKSSLSPSRNLMALSQPGAWMVMVCGPSGGVECPSSVVIGLKAIICVVFCLQREREEEREIKDKESEYFRCAR